MATFITSRWPTVADTEFLAFETDEHLADMARFYSARYKGSATGRNMRASWLFIANEEIITRAARATAARAATATSN